MESDFSLKKLTRLYSTFLSNNYEIITFSGYLEKRHKDKAVILRHDVDRLVKNALKIAILEHEMDIQSSYYFRCKKGTFNTRIIKEISGLGHEIGYHYEVLAKTRGDLEKGFDLFKKELEQFREIAPIKTICMHGSPLSRWDSRKLWEKFDYRELGITGEPYIDIDYDSVAYFTDTGRRWNGENVSIRDKVVPRMKHSFSTTDELITAFRDDKIPDKVMINIHPQRWHTNFFLWTVELIGQNLKNIIKRFFVNKEDRRNNNK
jgi:hypothetical protein